MKPYMIYLGTKALNKEGALPAIEKMIRASNPTMKVPRRWMRPHSEATVRRVPHVRGLPPVGGDTKGYSMRDGKMIYGKRPY